ncbi:MAG: hypothetical protein EOO51_14795 [Flavobacterium sp.]|nr:MAG: hypothetical protein EOO51_14795 [Flavobacterium sp.]
MKKFLFLFVFLAITLNSKAQTVYKTPSGQKYHTDNCRTVKNKSEALTVQQAAELGLLPCKICKPAVSHNLVNTKSKTSGEKPETTQCLGMTKKGTRCKHRTSIGNGYCFQHQPD